MINDLGLVIFDCDGVLVDTEPIAIRVHVAVGAELGWPITEAEVIELFVGKSATSVAEIIAGRVGDQVATTWTDEVARLHREAVDAELTAVAGIVDALDEIKIPTCVASSGSHDKLRHSLTRTGLYQRFEGRIFSAADVKRGKPAPDLFLHAATTMGVPPQACVVVEDSRYGVQAARAAGMRSLGYAGGVTPAAWLEGPDTVVFDDMAYLPHLLAQLS